MSDAGEVLVVDDHAQSRALTEAQLEAAGYRVARAESGAQALQRFARGGIDLVLLDIQMPELDGFETCRRLRALPGGEDLAIVFLTAHQDHELHGRALESGADDFLSKPLHRTELLLRVRSLIRIVRLRGELRRKHDALLALQTQKELLTTLLVHDLTNPLAGILANGEFLLDAVEATDPREAVRDILDSAKTMRQMVMNLLDISRAEDGALVVNRTEVDFGRLFDTLRERAKRRLRKNQKIDVVLGDGLVPVAADVELLERTVDNLLDNCLRHAPPASTVTLEARSRDGAVEIAVRDEGKGIAELDRERVFEKYAQVRQPSGGRTGRGLGLVFCRLAIEAHGGRIWVEDNQPQGAVFRIRLPLP